MVLQRLQSVKQTRALNRKQTDESPISYLPLPETALFRQGPDEVL